MERGVANVGLEIACCEPTWRGEWNGAWEKCTILTSSKNRVTVQCHTDNLITSCKSNFLRWTCNNCTFINPFKTSLVECAMCQNPIIAAAAVQQPNRKRSESEESQLQEPKNSRSESVSESGIVLPGSSLAQLVCTTYQIAGCDADHVGAWTGLWEDCRLLSSADTQFIDIQILSDGVVCKQVPRKFLRLKKTTFSLVDRQWL